MVKNVIKKILQAFGYRISRLTAELESYEIMVLLQNFVNLAGVYEQCLNNDDDLILPNEVRFKLLARLLGTPPSEAYFIVQALSKSKDLPGDVCEFGVAQGETSALIANEVSLYGNNKHLHLFDSFEGLPSPSEKDQLKDDIFALGTIESYAGAMSCPEDMVRSRLDAIAFSAERYTIHKGFIEKLIHEDKALPKEVCFAYVDFDFYEPIKTALDFLHCVTPSGAIIIVDDYDFFSTGAKTAVDEFIQSKMLIGTTYRIFVPNTRYGHFAILTRD